MSNVLLVMSDEHNPRISQPYGHPFVQTPAMQRLAKSGVVFENAYTPCPLCLPARSSFYSGRRVHQIQVYNNCSLLLGSYPAYGRVLTDQGVHSVHMGKSHAYKPLATMGFSEIYFPEKKDPGPDRHISRKPLAIRSGAAQRASGFGPKADPLPNDRMAVEQAVRWLRETAPRLKQPWTLDVNLLAPHFPHYCPPDLWEMYAAHADLPQYDAKSATAQHPYAQDLRDHFECDQFTEQQIRGLRQGYYGCVTMVDRQLAQLLDALDASGAAQDTVVVYTSDHGDMLGKFGMWWKCSLYEDSVRVPLIVAGPGFGRGRRVQTPVDLLDLQATLFAATETRRPTDWTGQPLQDIPQNNPNRVVFSEYHGHGTRSGAFMIRKGDWKLIHSMEAPGQLFNLRQDPEELANRYDQQPAKVRELERELAAICSPQKENDRAHALEQKQLEQIDQLERAQASTPAHPRR